MTSPTAAVWPPVHPWDAHPRGTSVAGIVGAIFVGLWTVLVAVLLPGVLLWGAQQALLLSGTDLPGWAAPVAAWMTVLLTGTPAVLLATLSRDAAIRAIGRSWMLAALASGLLGTARAVPLGYTDEYLALLAVLAGVAAASVTAAPALCTRWWYDLPRGFAGHRPVAAGRPGAAFGVAAGLACLLPWLWLGSLGGVWETVFAGLAALGVGLFTAQALDLDRFADRPTGQRVGLGGLVAGVFLTLIASGVGADGLQLAELLVLPSLGFTVAALYPTRPRWRRHAGPPARTGPTTGPTGPTTGPTGPTTGPTGPTAGANGPTGRERRRRWVPGTGAAGVASLVALATFGPLAFVDPVEVSLLLGMHEIGYWALLAALAGMLVAWLSGIAYTIVDAARSRRERRTVGRHDEPDTAGPAQGGRPDTAGPAQGGRPDTAGPAQGGRPDTAGPAQGGRPDSVPPPDVLPGAARRPRSRAGAVLVTIVAVAAGGLYVTAGHPGLHSEDLFVVMRGQADLSGLAGISDVPQRRVAAYGQLVAYADRTQASLRADLRRAHLGFTPYYLVNGIRVDGGPIVRAWLSHRRDVDRVLLNPHLRPLPEPAPPMRGSAPAPTEPQWNIEMIGADRAWAQGVTGAGITVGMSDSGVDGRHPAVAGGFRGGNDSWYDPWNHSTAPVDHGGHGTHTTGLAVGRDGIGVAPGAQWMGCVNLDRDMANPAYYLDCLQFMLAPFPRGGDPLRDGNPRRAADVLSNSWGCPPLEGCDVASLRPAIAALTAAGIYVVAAAGNTGPDCRSITDAPAPYRESETVGAVDRERRVADFSSRGPVPGGGTKPDVLAPGVDVVSALPGGGYGPLDGTSMATPQVAGVVALLWSASPALLGDVARTTEILRRTAQPAAPVDSSGGPVGRCGAVADVTGAGIVNAPAALAGGRPAG